MKRIFAILIILATINPTYAFCFKSPEKAVKNVIESQFKYANKGDFDRYISTFDENYKNSDGFDLDVYSDLVQNVWSSYENLKYRHQINDIKVDNDKATVFVTEYTDADLALTKNYTGELRSRAESIYYLQKTNGKWKVISDAISDETTTMLYGQAKNLNIRITVPTEVQADNEYTESLEFIKPKHLVAIASIAADKVIYPQPKTQEVFRPMPEDNILERLFTANNDNANEYVVASIGLTQTNISDLSIKMSLTGFGYVIKRVNVIPAEIKENESSDDKNQ